MSFNTANRRVDRSSLIVLLITLLASALVMWIYVERNLLGDIRYHTLTSKMFGVPESLKAHGVDEFYWGRRETGWDGQFYYFMANDLLGTEATTVHIDSPAYRYQRIGLPLLAKGFSVLLLRDWVSPEIYYLTSLLLVCAASFSLARYFSSRGLSPYFSLVWALGLGTQVTMMNGLPDAAADALLALALVALMRGQMVLYAGMATLACLSREAYLLFPVFLMGVRMASIVRGRSGHGEVRAHFIEVLPHIVPMVCFGAWQLYIRLHFNVPPSSQASGILALPFVSLARYFCSGIVGHHLFVPAGDQSYREAILLVLFSCILVWSASLAWGLLRRGGPHQNEAGGVSVATVALVALYFCFGPIVMMHYTGYLKAANAFLFLIPMLLALGEGRVSSALKYFLIIYSILGAVVFFRDRVFQNISISRYTNGGDIISTVEQPCLADYSGVGVELARLEGPRNSSAFARLVAPYDFIAWVRVTNHSSNVLKSAHARGSVNLGSRWRRADLESGDHTATSDGPQTMFTQELKPGDTATMAIVVRKPKKAGSYVLNLGLVQHGCDWFNERSPGAGVYQLPYTLY